MQKKKLIAAAVAIALQTYYYPAMAADNDNNDDKKKCPTNISLLSETAREKLPATCLVGQEANHDWAWIAGSAAALITGIAIGNHDSGGSDHHSSPLHRRTMTAVTSYRRTMAAATSYHRTTTAAT